MKKILALVAVGFGVISVGILLMFFSSPPDLSPINHNEYIVDRLPRTGVGCLRPSPTLIERCAKAGGVLINYFQLGGAGNVQRYGCYPEGETTDYETPCVNDAECQGRCIWQGGDYIDPEASNTCSEFKKPFFTTVKEITRDVWCDDERTWPLDERT